MSNNETIVTLSLDLDRKGLVWHPEIGDEVSLRTEPGTVSILVDPHGMTPGQLRESFVWLPSVEQFVQQFEARQALIYHAGITETLSYEAVIKTTFGVIEATAMTLRLVFGEAMNRYLDLNVTESIH